MAEHERNNKMVDTLYSAREQATHDYEWRVSHGLMRRLFKMMRRQTNKLLSYETVMENLTISGQHDAGIKVIHVKQIVGSVGRTNDFDREFYPLDDKSRDRWVNVAGAMYSGKALPPVDVYQIHDSYFVIDGNHRISVMRHNGQEYVEAHVIEVDTPTCIDMMTGEPSTCHCER
jgi:hypothetical protein